MVGSRRGAHFKEFRPQAQAAKSSAILAGDGNRPGGRCIGERTELKVFRFVVLTGLVAAAVWTVSARPWALGAEPVDRPWPAPEFTHSGERDWINSRPLELAGLEGRVVLVDFWTHGGWNSRRSMPWLKELISRFSDDALVVVGVHTPEFKHEMDPAGVRRQVQELGLRHPVMMDNDFPTGTPWAAATGRPST